MRERLHRLEETFDPLPIYFVTACTHAHQPILSEIEVHQCLIRFGEAGESHGAWLGAYVLMPDHLHLFVVVDDERINLSVWMKSLKNTISKALRARSIPPPHWQ